MAYDEANDDILLGMDEVIVRWNETDGITTTYSLAPYWLVLNEYVDIEFINEMIVAKDGALWIASDNGLLRFDGNVWTQFTKANGLPDNVILTVALAPNGDVWVGTKYGAARFDGISWHIYKSADGFLINEVKKIVVDKNNVVWIAPISTGIAAFDGENWKRYTTANGIPSGSINDMFIDDVNNLWITTSFLHVDPVYGSKLMSYDEHILFMVDKTFIKAMSFINEYLPNDFGFCGATPDNDVMVFSQHYYLNRIHINDDGGYEIYDSPRLRQGADDAVVDKHGVTWYYYHDQKRVLYIGKYVNDTVTYLTIDSNEVETETPLPFALAAHPNPFNPATTIDFTLPEAGAMSLRVYDVTGRAVGTLKEEYLPAGNHSVVFDGERLASGVYFFRLEAKGYVRTGKMTLMK